jgi:hypothetical protein
MRIWLFTLAHWHTQEDASKLAADKSYFGLNHWLIRARFLLDPRHVFIASGTWSDPLWNPLGRFVPVINSGATLTKPYEARYWNYAACAFTGALAYALNQSTQWDLLCLLDTDALVGRVNFDALLREFAGRPETYLTAAWDGPPGGPFAAWKHAGASRWLHQRRRANLVASEATPEPILIEEEWGEIYRDTWWNPWPENATLRQDNRPELNDAALGWPFVRMPCAEIVERYLALNMPKPVCGEPSPVAGDDALYGAAPKVGFA